MQKLAVITKELQRPDMTLSLARKLFDGVRKKVPELKQFISPDSVIVKHKDFENAIVKLGNQQEVC